MNPVSSEQYTKALRAGQKYYKTAVSHGDYPYTLALDELLKNTPVAGYSDLGVVNIPSELIVGTKTAGRVAALAGNFMPLLAPHTEFATKWMNLCDAHLSEEGIRDAILCYEYMGKFYVLEGNKRVSVLKSYEAPSISGLVTRVIPRYSDDHDVQLYYEFMRFYELSGQYGVDFRHRGWYDKLQAALGFGPDQVWTEDEQRSFRAGFSHFRKAFQSLSLRRGEVTPAEALLIWLQVYSFSEIKDLPPSELTRRLTALWPDIVAQAEDDSVALNTEPAETNKGLLSRLRTVGRSDHIDAAFLYAYPPEKSPWTAAHDGGVRYLDEHLGDRVGVKTYIAQNGNYFDCLTAAAEEGADIIFATAPTMIDACRRASALYPKVKLLNCGLFQPYPGVRMYYSRVHECQFIAGAVAGALSETGELGFVANYPIFGVPAGVNAFALGARLTNPRARVRLRWSCLPGDPVRELLDNGITVISNRDAGTCAYRPDGSFRTLAAPLLYWGELYERITLSVLNGAWRDIAGNRAINYWWGMDSGSLDVALDDELPDGTRSLALLLKDGLTGGSVSPFRSRIRDQSGELRCDGSRTFSPEEIMTMDWLCDNVEGGIPGFEELKPESRDTVVQMGLYRRALRRKTEENQL